MYRERERERERETCTVIRGYTRRHLGHVKTGADTRVMQPQVQEHQGPPEAERSRLDFFAS